MWHEYTGLQPCIDALCADIAGRLRARLEHNGSCTLAVSGGRTPVPLFDALSKVELDWARVQVRLVDERHVPPHHPDSNEGLVRRHLLVGNAAVAQFHGLYRPGENIDEAVAAANDETLPIHLALLGMGDDGHMASLFPDASQLDEALAPDAPRYLHITPPDAPHERISLSLAALRACDHLILHITGAHKREVLFIAEHRVNPQLPISYLAAEPGDLLDVHWHP